MFIYPFFVEKLLFFSISEWWQNKKKNQLTINRPLLRTYLGPRPESQSPTRRRDSIRKAQNPFDLNGRLSVSNSSNSTSHHKKWR